MKPLSYTKFFIYSKCPLMFKFTYVDRLPERPRAQYSFGRSIHKAIELFHRHDPPPASLDDLIGYLDAHWERPGYESDEHEMEAKTLARDILTRFHEEETRAYVQPLRVEHQFNVTIEGIPLTGRIDVLNRLEDGSIEVLDYKSGEGLPTEAEVKDAPQLGIYQLAVEKELGSPVTRLTVHQVRYGKRISAPPLSDERKADLRRAIVTTAKCIEAGMFEPVLSDDCPCDRPEHCPYFKDLFRGKGQTTLLQHDEASPGSTEDIDDVVGQYSVLLREEGADHDRLGHLGAIIRRYCRDRDILRIFARDITATLVSVMAPSDEWYLTIEIGEAPKDK